MDSRGATIPTRPRPRIAVPADLPIIITIDGPAGTGKSSVARALASRLGLDFLDTGAMYRAAAAIVIDHGIPHDDYGAIVEKVRSADLHFDWSRDPPAMLAWDRPINGRIREPDVTAIVSPISAIPELRAHMVQKQRIIWHQHPRLVSEGRDQGSVVFPDAAVKFYLDADPAERARRRADQLRTAGLPADEADLLRDIVERDRSDSTRPVGPLICPQDAVRVDTTRLSFDEVVDRLEDEVRARIAALL
ncbi:MAG: (d)CMP kinase [Leptolyngbya sp. PLA2]|nr:(d)CMP kinase [Leptolyngbya sp.]MCE7972484.1 (d)CMP kinase [Leptolyngbya sp. PL-A2]MCQ3941133.1 (d)CMP kinase [cyanobacterium CYA1]MDL1905417.1 (d)CMP kinase [Synechococcales cyanobacterium CNB]